MSDHDSASAPPDVRWCCKCRSEMGERQIGGKPRRACPNCGYIHFVEAKVGVGVCVIKDSRILLVRRRFAPGKGKWSVPAGYLDHGEEPKAHAVHELREETGLEIEIAGLIDVFHNPPEDGGATVLILYRGEIKGGTLAAGDDASEAAFFLPDELPELAFASTRHAIRLLAGGD